MERGRCVTTRCPAGSAARPRAGAIEFMPEAAGDCETPSLVAGFLRSCERFPRNIALSTRAGSQTYSELADAAGRIAAALVGNHRSETRLGAVLGARSPTVYQGILGTLLSGAGYVPLNPKFPTARTLQ